jgi:sigma-B regulation protein RsbU (phosphoserine phosphatase)
MFRFKSIHRRLTVFMLLPVAFLLVMMGYAGFIYTRNHLLSQWAEAAILQLQQAAHHVDMRLKEPKELLKLFHQSETELAGTDIRNVILNRLRQLDGVVRVSLQWSQAPGSIISSPDQPSSGMRHSPMRQHSGLPVDITPPVYDAPLNSQTVSMVSELKRSDGRKVGRLTVVLRFDSLISAVETTGWQQAHKAFLTDAEGRILTGNLAEHRQQLGDNKDLLEKTVRDAMRSRPFGTIIGKGTPPGEVAGFYKLNEAPWTLVVVSPGRDVLAPITHFQTYYVLIGAAFIFLILLLIRWVSSRTADAIKAVSSAAGKVAKGDYSIHLPVKTQDEVGELILSFNTMLDQLEERARLKESIHLAMEVQRNLLPASSLTFEGLDIAGASIYCDETGGDYFDYLRSPTLGLHTLGVAVGDVTGHGVAAALLMTTARALLRSRVSQPGTLCEMISDVNRLLSLDTELSGSFMTLFLMTLDACASQVSWVRAGHDPAILYDPKRDDFEELGGDGIALGVDKDWACQEYQYGPWSQGQVIIIGTDGIWETENDQGKMFGKNRLQDAIRRSRLSCAQDIMKTIIDDLKAFQAQVAQKDDVTLVVIKVG